MRTRLFRLLDRSLLPLVWVSALPGAGKTTLVSHYLEQRRRKHLWYQVDPGDNDVADLFHHLSLVVKTTGGVSGLAPETAAYFERLGLGGRPALVAVLENYQQVDGSGRAGSVASIHRWHRFSLTLSTWQFSPHRA